MIKVLFVCHGNICRSTMAESIFANEVKVRGIEEHFHIDSAATSREEIGNPPHRETVKKLMSQGILVVDHRAKQVTREDEENFDYIVIMDDNNRRNIEKIIGKSNKVFRLLSFAGINRDIADPWYTGDFDETYQDIRLGIDGFLEYLEDNEPEIKHL